MNKRQKCSNEAVFLLIFLHFEDDTFTFTLISFYASSSIGTFDATGLANE